VGRDPPRVRLPYAAVLPIAYVAEALSRVSGRAGRITLEGVRMSRKRMFFSSAKAQRELGLCMAAAGRGVRRRGAMVSRARTHSGPMTSAPREQAAALHGLRDEQDGHAEHDVARPLQQGNRKPEFRADAEERCEQGVGRFLYAESARHEHGRTAHRADEGLDRDRDKKSTCAPMSRNAIHVPAPLAIQAARCTAQESATRERDRVNGIEHRPTAAVCAAARGRRRAAICPVRRWP
jgi:hypothetical protein